MAKALEYERRTIECAEEKRTATLLLEWKEEGGRRTLVGVECDNPKLRGLEPYVCRWSCWHKLEPAAEKKATGKPGVRVAPKPAKKAVKKQAVEAVSRPMKKAAPSKTRKARASR